MMNKAAENIMIWVIKKRIEAGENVEHIFSAYPRLTEEEKQELTKAVS